MTGQIQKINRHVGEWVQAGETVLHLVQVNQLRVQGTLKISEFAPEEVMRPARHYQRRVRPGTQRNL